MHAMFMIFLAVAVLAAAMLLFVFWIVITVIRGLTRLILGPGLKSPRPLPPPPADRCCRRDGCRAVNPPEARFCKRCGERLDDRRHVPVPRAAMF